MLEFFFFFAFFLCTLVQAQRFQTCDLPCEGGVATWNDNRTTCFCKCFWGHVGDLCDVKLDTSEWVQLLKGVRKNRANGNFKFVTPRNNRVQFEAQINVNSDDLKEVCADGAGTINVHIDLLKGKRQQIRDIKVAAGVTGKETHREQHVSQRFRKGLCYVDPYNRGSLLSLPECDAKPLPGETLTNRPTNARKYCDTTDAKITPCWHDNSATGLIVCCESPPVVEEYVSLVEILRNHKQATSVASFTLKLGNRYTKRLSVDLYVHKLMAGGWEKSFLKTVEVGVGQISIETFSYGTLGIDVDTLTSAGSIAFQALAKTSPDDRYLRGASVTDTIYIMPSGNARLPMLAMTEQLLIDEYDSGDFGSKYQLEDLSLETGPIIWVPSPFPFVDPHTEKYHDVTPTEFSSPTEKLICVALMPFTSDHGAGEDYYPDGGLMAARGVRYRITQDGNTHEGYLDSHTGCVKLPLNDNDNIYVRIFNDLAVGPEHNFELHFHMSYDDFYDKVVRKVDWVIKGTTKDYICLVPPSNVWTVMLALSGFSAYRLDQVTGHFDQLKTQHVIYRTDVSNSYLGVVTKAQLHMKFLHAHEIGHSFDKLNLSLLNVATNEKLDLSKEEDIYCWSKNAPGNHLFWSLEENPTAALEGNAQFFSTVVWNNLKGQNAKMRYYKNVSEYPGYGEMVDSGNIVDMLGKSGVGGVKNWRDNRCQNSNVTHTRSVEGDWARALCQLVFKVDGNPALMTMKQLKNVLQGVKIAFIAEDTHVQRTDIASEFYPIALEAEGLGDLIPTWHDIAKEFGIDDDFELNIQNN